MLVECTAPKCGKRFLCTRQFLTRTNPKTHCGCQKPVAEFKLVEYTAWNNMVQRCYNEKHISYKAYGAKGVTVCPEWLPPPYGTTPRDQAFASFLACLGDRPKEHPVEGPYSLDRKDAKRGYDPGNVQWATELAQARNKRNTKWVRDPRPANEGRSIKAAVLAQELGLTYQQLRARMIDAGTWE